MNRWSRTWINWLPPRPLLFSVRPMAVMLTHARSEADLRRVLLLLTYLPAS